MGQREFALEIHTFALFGLSLPGAAPAAASFVRLSRQCPCEVGSGLLVVFKA
jgi:hypothetical protein